jgi:hypothetical protein
MPARLERRPNSGKLSKRVQDRKTFFDLRIANLAVGSSVGQIIDICRLGFDALLFGFGFRPTRLPQKTNMTVFAMC